LCSAAPRRRAARSRGAVRRRPHRTCEPPLEAGPRVLPLLRDGVDVCSRRDQRAAFAQRLHRGEQRGRERCQLMILAKCYARATETRKVLR
ncbi:MAG: hypothetical protein VYB74_05685, partial [Cyanobacteriota bacterium]|nr:hypothetical protein [Cyanobacteriota bacterium]